MKEYELTVLIHPDLEADLETKLESVRGLVTGNGGKVVVEETWGKKKLAYQINKQDFGLYHYMEVSLPAEAPLAISNTLNITDGVLRYLLVKVDQKGRAALAAAKEKAAKRAEKAA